jgi:hypothetical protein
VTQVYLTVDVECREERYVGKALLPAAGYDLRVFGRFANQKRELGIDLIMGNLDEFGLKATFFVEPIGSAFFGLGGLSSVCRTIRERGHDVQLHIHPGQAQAFWISKNESLSSDNLADYPLEKQTAFLRRGMDILEEAGVPRGEIVAFRAGNFGGDNDTWKAMKENGLRVSSTYNPSYLASDCKIRWPKIEAGLFDTGCGVWELPVTNFREPGGAFRPLQVTAVGLPEMKHLLLQAHRLGLQEITLVTHSFEFFHLDSVAQRSGRINLVNARRLRGICRFLSEHADLFKVKTLADLAKDLPTIPRQSMSQFPRGRRDLKALRLVDQVYKRIEARYPFEVHLPMIGSWERRDIWPRGTAC